MSENTQWNEEKRRDLPWMDPRKILMIKGANIREFDINDPDDVWLINSIRENGLQQPLTVRINPEWKKGEQYEYIAVDGHRRLSAILHLLSEGFDLPLIPVLKKKLNEEEVLTQMFISNGGKPLRPLERAEGVRRFIEVHGYEIADVARKISESEATVRNLHEMSKLPNKIKKHIQDQDISPTLAQAIRRKYKNENDFVVAIEELVTSKQSSDLFKKPKVTAKDAVKIIGTKNTTKLLGAVYATLDSEGHKGERIDLLKQLVDILNDSPTQEKIYDLFKNNTHGYTDAS